ncbi:glycosyltransferase family 4 protein [Ramlibacter albus]|uniref:Glycosyltransferase family 4 protein n=1 Tax=Ramlibacter albus TaxID=2079448 RepID=A0A923S6L8_9BURK|nr:glycosyltransferase family 4 protein [Ramlibacter albus]MBC5766282.1 glycosyltransferase family 4 protein [Ramlibacter albus]
MDSLHILVAAHHDWFSGAQVALVNLIGHLRALGHRVTVLCPRGEGSAASWYEQAGLPFFVWDLPWAVHDPPAAVAAIEGTGLDQAAAAMAAQSVDLVISNTLVQLHPAMLAARMGVPHITWAHELLGGDAGLKPRTVPFDYYIAGLASLSDHMLCCSQAVRAEVQAASPATSTSVLFPYMAPDLPAPALEVPREGPIGLVFVGDLTARKNPRFAVQVLEALCRRGHDAVLDFYGVPRDESRAVAEQVERSGVVDRVAFHGFVDRWRDRIRGRPIHLVASTCEPFGLTLPECMAAGVPVVASASGGPSELLPAQWLYRVGDLDEAVHAVETIARSHEASARHARSLHDRCTGLQRGVQQETVQAALRTAFSRFRPKETTALLFR